MIKQIFLIIAFSIATMFFRQELSHFLDWLVVAHNYIADALSAIFSDDNVGRLLQDIIALLIIPIACGLVVALIFWLMKHSAMPHIMLVIWIIWLVLVTTMVAQTDKDSIEVKDNAPASAVSNPTQTQAQTQTQAAQ